MALNQRRGSSYEQAEAEICRVEVGEVAVALGPPAGVEVVAEASHRPLLGLRPASAVTHPHPAERVHPCRTGVGRPRGPKGPVT